MARVKDMHFISNRRMRRRCPIQTVRDAAVSLICWKIDVSSNIALFTAQISSISIAGINSALFRENGGAQFFIRNFVNSRIT